MVFLYLRFYCYCYLVNLFCPTPFYQLNSTFTFWLGDPLELVEVHHLFEIELIISIFIEAS
jgi:hypothetical protein